LALPVEAVVEPSWELLRHRPTTTPLEADTTGPKRILDRPRNAALRQVNAPYGGFYSGTVFSSQCGIHML
jgi:hypothetical protein